MQHMLHHVRAAGDESVGWLLISYRAPKQPSTARVAAWRRLHRLGALYIGPSTCLLPVGLADDRALAIVSDGITSAGGGIDSFRIEAFTAEAVQVLVQRFNAERDAEYTEVVERAEALLGELAREARRGKFTFAEVEENEADLIKLRRWLAVIGRRDRYGAPGRAAAQQAVADADEALRVFTERRAHVEVEAHEAGEAGPLPLDDQDSCVEDEAGGVR
jgi:hypothetical protein